MSYLTGDLIIGKVTPIKNLSSTNTKYKNNSNIYKNHNEGVIDRVKIKIDKKINN